MKIIYLHQYFKFPDEQGGTRSYDLATSFVKEGHKVIVVSATQDLNYDNKERWNKIEKEGLTIHYIFLPYGNHLSYLKRSMVFFQFLWFSTFKLFKIKSDVVLATSTPLTIGIPALLKKWFHKTPFVFEVRDVWPEAVIAIGAIKNKVLQSILYKLEKLIYKNSFAIVPLSVDMQKSIVTRYPNYAQKTEIVIPNISEINRFQQVSSKIDWHDRLNFTPRFSVLYAGTFGKVNGIEYVINLAAKTIKLDPSLVYILIGQGAQKEDIINLAQRKNVLNKNVFIFDPIAKQELPKWYNSTSMGSSFVIDIKELWANSANKFFDTLAAGNPVLINYEGWQAEVIRKDNLGYVLPPQITLKAAQDFVLYTQDEELYKTQKMNALNKAKESYSLEVAYINYLRIFNKIQID